MNRISQPLAALPLAIAALSVFALPGLADSLPAAMITTSLDQCEEQICGTFPHVQSYSGNLSAFPGSQTVGEGAFVSAAGFASPTLTSEVPSTPTEGANAIVNAELTYVLEVVPVDGSTTSAPVEIGVSAVGSNSVTTVSGAPGSNSANSLVQLALESDLSGGQVFNDTVNIVYSAGLNDLGQCITSNPDLSTTNGAGVLNSLSISCGTSSASGGFTEAGSYSISTNSPYLVVMQTNLTVGTSNDGLADGTGSVEGIVSLDPVFTVPAGYILEFSAGVGNGTSGTTATPEPTAWVLLVTGVGIAAALRRREVNRASRAAAQAR